MKNKVSPGKLFVFIGPPGSGKGSLAESCVQKLGWAQLSTGNLCRKHIAEQTSIGKQIDLAIKSGKLVSDSLIVDMAADWFAEHADRFHNIILDGFPRTVAQAEALNKLLKEKFSSLQLVVVRFTIADEAVVQRLCNRYVCKNKECQAVYSLAQGSSLRPKNDMVCDFCSSNVVRRADDNEAAIRERLVVYHKHENALLDFYVRAGYKIEKLNIEKPLKDVFEDFKKLAGLGVE